MQIRVIRKALGMLFAYFVIIIGIFVLQFRTDSSILKKIRNLHITMEKSEEENPLYPLKNKLQISYNGLILFIDDQNPAWYTKRGINHKEEIRLIDWTSDEKSCTFQFTDDIKLTVGLSSDDDSASFYAESDMPEEIAMLYLPFKFNSYMKILEEGNRTILSGKKLKWELNSPSIVEKTLAVSRKSPRITYAIHKETSKFTFESISEIALASPTLFLETRNAVKNNLITQFKANIQDSNLTEQIAISYVAAQASNGNYNTAIEEVPQSIKKSKTRTYLSAPYFNTLAEMDGILETYIANTDIQIAKAAATGSLDIFTIRNIANFMYNSKNINNVEQILTKTASADLSAIPLSQATGIIQTYVELYNLKPEYAALLKPAVESCISRICEACSYASDTLTISENGNFISVIQATEIGTALARYGQISESPVYEKGGYIILNSYLSGSNSFDLRTLANIYPVLFYDNPNYPHFEKIHEENGVITWAWTCTSGIEYKADSPTSTTISIPFPAGSTHYIIIKGIKKFTSIYIYDIAFRTDARFESYNSSGYIYKADTSTLLLKSRHKEDIEDIRFDYTVKRAEPKPEIIDISPEATENQPDEEAGGESTGPEGDTATSSASSWESESGR